MNTADEIPKLSREREFEIAALAERQAMARFQSAPIDPERLAADEGITFCYAAFLQKFDGLLLYEENKFILVCNDRRHPRGSPRSRFTFAHELGHYFIPSHRQALLSGLLAARIPRRGPWGSRIMEQESDLFAANLLMPGPLFCRMAATTPGTTLEQISALADTFGTSIMATAYRALELDLLRAPSAVFLWNRLGEPAGRRVSEATEALGPAYLGLTKKPPLGSVSARAIADLKAGIHEGESHLMDWFTELDGYGPEHQIEVAEEVMSLGHFGWMTIVSPSDLTTLPPTP